MAVINNDAEPRIIYKDSVNFTSSLYALGAVTGKIMQGNGSAPRHDDDDDDVVIVDVVVVVVVGGGGGGGGGGDGGGGGGGGGLDLRK